MIVFTARSVLSSKRWVSPLLVWITLFVVIISGGNATGPELATMLFPTYMVLGAWLTVITGNIDDDAHRDLVSAAVGSASRLHRFRSATVLLTTSTLAFVVSVAVALLAEPGASMFLVIADTSVVSVAGLMVGVGIGTLLHRPILRHRGISVIAACGGVMLFVLLPPVQSALRSFNEGQRSSGLLLFVGALAWVLLATVAASELATRRSQ